MKATVTTSTMFKAILAFTFLFSGFLALTITYNRVYKIKNESILMIEKYEGVTDKSLTIINNYLFNSGYDTVGNCETGEYGVPDLDEPKYELAQSDKKYYYCLSYYCSYKGCSMDKNKVPNGNEIFYQAKFFFKFNLPIMGDLMVFKITGDTKAIKLYSNNQKLK